MSIPPFSSSCSILFTNKVDAEKDLQANEELFKYDGDMRGPFMEDRLHSIRSKISQINKQMRDQHCNEKQMREYFQNLDNKIK